MQIRIVCHWPNKISKVTHSSEREKINPIFQIRRHTHLLDHALPCVPGEVPQTGGIHAVSAHQLGQVPGLHQAAVKALGTPLPQLLHRRHAEPVLVAERHDRELLTQEPLVTFSLSRLMECEAG